MNCYYVYEHVRTDTGQVFYVGKGKGRRAKASHGRNKWWKNVVSKTGYTVRFISENLSECDALRIEKETISLYRSKGIELCNISDGGEIGPTGRKVPLERIEKMRKTMTGKKRGSHTLESRLKMSVAGKGKNSKNVLCCETNTSFNSILSAAEYIFNQGLSKTVNGARAGISSCLTGKNTSAYGYKWVYKT